MFDPPEPVWKWLSAPPREAVALRRLVTEQHPDALSTVGRENWFRGVEDNALLLCTGPENGVAYKPFVFIPDGPGWKFIDLGEPVFD